MVVQVESVRDTTVQMLDLELYLGDRFKRYGLLDYRLFTKPTEIWIPLSPTSEHSEGTHKAWPKALLQRVGSRCSSSSVAEHERHKLLQKLSRRGIVVHRSSHFRKRTGGIVQSRIIVPWCRLWNQAKTGRILSPHNIGIAIRPEMLRHRCACTTCTSASRYSAPAHVTIELKVDGQK